MRHAAVTLAAPSPPPGGDWLRELFKPAVLLTIAAALATAWTWNASRAGEQAQLQLRVTTLEKTSDRVAEREEVILSRLATLDEKVSGLVDAVHSLRDRTGK